MPPRLSRILIALTLALAVPVQGTAAAAAGLCMALGHHDAGSATSHDHATGHGAHHIHDDDSGADHQHGHGADNSPANAHCPPCVACCAAAAISSFAGIFIPELPTAAVVAAPEPSLSGIQLGRLDRPPPAL